MKGLIDLEIGDQTVGKRVNIFLDALRRGGFRLTSQRRVICDLLARTAGHPSPLELYERVQNSHPEISRATVYNTLNSLRDLGAIVQLNIGSEQSYYETNPEPHLNLICLRCSRVFDYEPESLSASLFPDIREAVGFQPVAIQMQIVGFCEDCQEQKRAEIRARLQSAQYPKKEEEA